MTISPIHGMFLPSFEINVGEAENIVSPDKKEFSIDEFNFVKANWVDNKYSDYMRFKFNNAPSLIDSPRDMTIIGFIEADGAELEVI